MVKGFMKPEVFELLLAKDKFRVELEHLKTAKTHLSQPILEEFNISN
jgi:hypothetical protein